MNPMLHYRPGLIAVVVSLSIIEVRGERAGLGVSPDVTKNVAVMNVYYNVEETKAYSANRHLEGDGCARM